MPMPGRARQRWLAVLLVAWMAACPGRLRSQSDDPPAGFVRENLKEIRASMLRPENSFFKPYTQAGQLVYYFSLQPLAQPSGVENGIVLIVIQHGAKPREGGWSTGEESSMSTPERGSVFTSTPQAARAWEGRPMKRHKINQQNRLVTLRIW